MGWTFVIVAVSMWVMTLISFGVGALLGAAAAGNKKD